MEGQKTNQPVLGIQEASAWMVASALEKLAGGELVKAYPLSQKERAEKENPGEQILLVKITLHPDKVVTK